MAVCLTAIFSCASTIKPIPAAKPIKPEQQKTTLASQAAPDNMTDNSVGKTYLLFAIDSDDLVKEVSISGWRSLSFEPEYNEQKISYVLAEIKPGDYEFSTIETGLLNNHLDDEIDWSFTIEQGKVNYVGHLEINQELLGGAYFSHSKIELVNKSSFAIEYLQAHHPALFTHNPLTYQGPGQDDFIGYYYFLLLNGASHE
ncbi:MAG: hypothetical protein ACSHW0_14780 [Thalassotalea sp.]